MRKLWLHAIRRENFTASTTTVICEKHFTLEDYEVSVHGNKVLKKVAVPSVFDFPAHLKKEPSHRRVLKRKHEESNSKATEHTLAIAEVVEEPENGNILAAAGPSNLTQKLGFLESSERSNICNLRVRRSPVYFGDFEISDLNNVQHRKRFWKTVHKYKKINKYNQCKIRRQRNKIKSLNSLVDELLKEKRISAAQSIVLKESLPETQKQLLFRQLKKGKSNKYSPELRCFALTLNFYSSSAYNYVRKIFGKNVLPHPHTLSKWYSVLDRTPGYSAEALRAIKIKVDVDKQKGKQLVGALMMEEMYIRQHVHWTGSRLVGYINIGVAMQSSEEIPKTKKALVFMVVCINSRWKVPIAYFLVESSSAEEKATFVRGCLLQLESTGMLIKSLTFDGDAYNILMANLLGANLTFPGTKPFFINSLNNEKIHIILDACHMIKLVRNTLGDYGVLKDGGGKDIRWEYFKRLVNLQEDTGLQCATKLRRRYLNYYKEKMRVKLAV
ncbi:unnamed protein product [Acanthoscelides obtectus]|nr:unnamed protein product [Acanthoscelides obtectus]CAK1681673.1 DNA transposase THAP9 [Acanthoscelides obtectus]